MFNNVKVETGLGQTTSSSSLWDTLLANVEKGVTAGWNIYDKVKQLQDITKVRKQAQEQANMFAQIRAAQTQAIQQQTVLRGSGTGGVGWGTIGLIGLGSIGLILLLKK